MFVGKPNYLDCWDGLKIVIGYGILVLYRGHVIDLHLDCLVLNHANLKLNLDHRQYWPVDGQS